MNLIKTGSTPFSATALPSDEEFSAVLEPKPGYSRGDLEHAARTAEASQLQWLDDSKLSAVIKRGSVELLSSVAHISPKRRKVLR
jgi:hypothetical protein